MFAFLVSPGRWFLALECFAIFILMPLALFFHATRLNVHLTLWLVCAYAALILHKTPGFCWRQAWRGRAMTSREARQVAWRFVISTLGIILLAALIKPERLFSFPAQRPGFWLVVMLLYPILSALPQELIFRSFFFRRYAAIFPRDWMMLAASALVFGFIHIVFHNPVSPSLSLLCGFFLAGSYTAHRSLSRAAFEHAIYGDMVFTVGLGLYFLVGHIG